MMSCDKLCYLTLLCLASQNNGVIENCSEEVVIKLAGFEFDPMNDEDSDYRRAKGCIDRFVSLGCVTKSNASNETLLCRVTINAWTRRQEANLTNAERQERYRNRKKTPKIQPIPRVTKSNAPRNKSNAREEKRREEKNTTIAEPAIDSPFILKEYIKKMEDNPRRDLNIMALYFEKRNPDIKTYAQMKEAIHRHLRAAKSLSVFTDEQILKACNVAEREYPKVWTIETLVKLVTK